jgi:Ser/Thr protein kinase RdoA (MazF antagonist)
MNPIFPASYSTLCPNALAVLIADKFNLTHVSCKLLVKGVGDTYLVETPATRFILRVYRSSHRSLPQIKEEVQLLQELKRAGVSVSYPVADAKGGVIIKVNAAEGERHAVLFSYAAGTTVKLLDENQLRNLGQEMARFHNVSAKLSLGEERWVFDANTTLYKPLELIRPAFVEDPAGYAWLEKVVNQVNDKVYSADSSTFSKGYCHFDFLPKNFHFEGEAITLFDFDFMGHGLLVNDIMSFWQHLMLDVYTQRMTGEAAREAYKVFLVAYGEHRPVSTEELALVPYLSIGFWLFYMGFHTTHDQFYVYTQPGQVKAYTAILKHIVENYWTETEL